MELKIILIVAIVIGFLLLSGWAFKEKSEKGIFQSLRLLPNWMKYVGMVWIIVSLILPFVFNLTFEGKNYLGIQSVNLGLLIICLSRDRNEDEMTNMIRLKSFYISVIAGFCVIIFLDLLEIVLGGKSLTESFNLIGLILFLYLITFYQTKSKVRSAK